MSQEIIYEDDARRQQADISMFAKLASGETFHNDIPAKKEEDDETSDDNRAVFAAMASMEDSGTFALSSSPNDHKAVASSNLDAAAYALTAQEEEEDDEEEGDAPLPLDEINLIQQRAIQEPMPMYNERVLLPRPLFFGAILPPRVIQEARSAILETMQELDLDLTERPPLYQLPPHIRNVVGALETLCHGIPLFPCEIKDPDSYRGSEYVSTYQPVLGDVARAEREALRKLRITETSFHSAEPSIGSEHEPSSCSLTGEEAQEQEAPQPKTGQGTSAVGGDLVEPEMATPLRSSRIDEPRIIGSPSFPGSNKSPSNISKSLMLRSKSAPTANRNNNNKPPPATTSPMSEKDQFLQWARGGKHASPQAFSRWARGKPPPVESKRSFEYKTNKSSRRLKKRSVTSPTGQLFLEWAQGDADQSPAVTPIPPVDPKSQGKVDTLDGTGTDVQRFSQWARGDDSPNVVISKSSRDEDSPVVQISDKNMSFKWAQDESSTPSSTPPPPPDRKQDTMPDANGGSVDEDMDEASADDKKSDVASKDLDTKDKDEEEASISEQDAFTQWARGDQDSGLSSSTTQARQPFDTFRAVPDSSIDEYSDDDGSVDMSELKKQVGMNEHLNKALESLARDGNNVSSGERPIPTVTESIGVDEANILLSQMEATTEGGRPLSNIEITNGAVPLFGYDDSPVPSETDLGIFFMKEDQTRSRKQRRSQEIVDKHSYPNIFGPVVCPNPAHGPDDNHSWNSRAAPARKQVMPEGATHQTSGPGIVPALDSPPKPARKYSVGGSDTPSTIGAESERNSHRDFPSTASSNSVSSTTPRTKRRQGQPRRSSFDANVRYGWWNVSVESEQTSKGLNGDEPLTDMAARTQLSPTDYGSSTPTIATRLSPSADKLRNENLPLSNLHAATSIESALPFLSDRPPSFRYLQIDTEAVGFPAVGGEIEPLFCSLAIYHVETTAPSSHDPRAAPVPNMQRCGRVTEVLNFDMVRDPEIEARCVHSLWPYSEPADGPAPSADQATQGSRCGVFPLASNLNISNLYAILIVHKVLSDKEGIEPYTKPLTPKDGSHAEFDVGKLRAQAETASIRHGRFLMPFAFGVAPLLQIFGTDIPTAVNSRAVQIPLFRFVTGQGDRPIIDHIMVMLYPRADHKGIAGPAPLTNGGMAMLVMRNFGYLGLHSAVFSKGSLARDRLVDFSGELQVRKEDPGANEHDNEGSPRLTKDGTYLVPPWHRHFVSEPAINGGRNPAVIGESCEVSDHKSNGSSSEISTRVADTKSDKSRSKFYAQELAPVPLRLMPLAGKSVASPVRVRLQRGRSALRAADTDPTFHTTFCNELLCQPRLLHNVPKGNIAIKVEVCEMEWSELHQAYLAHPPKTGPSLHNSRRGPFLVSQAFTACCFQAVHAHFLDEFKMKLPLILARKSVGGGVESGPLALLFSMCRVDIKSRRRWKDRRAPTVEVLACGFLPITTSDTSCLVDNGLHDVKMMYTSEDLPEDDRDSGTLILRHIGEEKSKDSAFSFRIESLRPQADGGEDDSLSNPSERQGTDAEESFFGSESAYSETAESDRPRSETSSGGAPSRSRSKSDLMTLQVRVVVHSSIHPQNATLNEFFGRIPTGPLSFAPAADSPSWKLSRPGLLTFLNNATDDASSRLDVSDDMEQLLLFTIDVSKPALCSAAESSTHFVRIFTQLMRTVVCGTGIPSILWANPACAIPLRMHAFATLLQTISSVNSYMMKNGATQLDGRGKWNLSLLGKVVAMIFDEEHLFMKNGSGTGEIISLSGWESMNSKLPFQSFDESGDKSQRRRRREQMRSRQSGKPEVKKNAGNENLSMAENLDDFLADFASASEPVQEKNESVQGDDSVKPLLAPNATVTLPMLLRIDSADEGPPTPEAAESKPGMKIDTKAEFQNNLWIGSAESLEPSPTSSGSNAAQNMIHAYAGVGPSSRKKWLTAPTSGLATIREDVTDLELNESTSRLPFNLDPVVTQISPERGREKAVSTVEVSRGDAVDSELVLRAPPPNKRVMRVPRRAKAEDDSINSLSNSVTSLSIPSTDDEIEEAGTAFLDEIGKSLGYSTAPSGDMRGEEQRVGHAHHRKTRSICSIDWSLPEDDLLMGGRSPLEQIKSLSTDAAPPVPPGALAALDESTPDRVSGETPGAEAFALSSLAEEVKNTVRLPNYLDRLVLLGNADRSGRWCPYAYEVIIFQWVSLLVDQRRTGEKVKDVDQGPKESSPVAEPTNSTPTDYPHGKLPHARQGLTDAAGRARGVAIACSPVLLEVIKKSIGWRVAYMFKEAKRIDRRTTRKVPPLLCLDDVLLAHLEQLISILTDACVDSRNFDSWDFRQTSIHVNDSIIRFLRDMFGFLQTAQVHRLMLVYLSRFVVKDGKHWQDRDSKIGLRCSWEISKLRLNAVTTLVRFPDFLRVNSPLVQNWQTWAAFAPSHLSRDFFSMSLLELRSLAMSGFVARAESDEISTLSLSKMTPHWLAEIVTDICLAGIEHVEQYIQHRAASLLHELFWSHSQEARAHGTSAMVATMYVPFLFKILGYTGYLANFTAKHQLRKDIIPCIIFVLQCAPGGIIRALGRKLCIQAEGKGRDMKYGGVVEMDSAGFRREVHDSSPDLETYNDKEEHHDQDIYDLFGLLNLALDTCEYEGSDYNVEADNVAGSSDQLATWKKEFLLAIDQDQATSSLYGHSMPLSVQRRKETDNAVKTYSTSSSRKWHAHDASIVIIHTSRLIVRETIAMLRSDPGEEGLWNGNQGTTAVGRNHKLNFSSSDIVVFVRAALSVYLHALALRQSDISIVKTLLASVEVVKLFGIKVFGLAAGETLQHWMRLISFHCGGRRAEVRVQALEFLWLLLRLKWDSYGSFLRIRVPLLSVQTEVMERIVATATARNYREQRRMGLVTSPLPNDCAEASLSPLWRTLDRLHHQSASQNFAFRSALVRLAESMKKLCRAYIAAHALAIVNRSISPLSPSDSAKEGDTRDEQSVYLQSRRVHVHRLLEASAGYSKQFLGLQRSSSRHATVAHNEAVEDAFLDAAYVFSPTELPSNRVAWLRKLAQFHASRKKYAEEATCRFHIHVTLRQAARVHNWLWGNLPFVAWTVNSVDGTHLGGEGPAGEPEDYYNTGDYDLEDLTVEDPNVFESTLGQSMPKQDSFRRQFFRVANSLRETTGDPGIGGKGNLFFGVTFAYEYRQGLPYCSLKEMEEELVDEVEMSGDLFLEAGIAESSRFAWSLATQIYAEKFNYGKLAHAYRRLANVVSSNVPVIDTTSQNVELSHPLGRFYRVWFHGGAPDEINGKEFVYRAPGSIKLKEFGDQLTNVIKGILPENTPIHLVLDDGRPETQYGFRQAQRRLLGPTPMETVKIKVTPLRPLLKGADRIRGSPEWFFAYAGVPFNRPSPSSFADRTQDSRLNLQENGATVPYSNLTHHARSSSASVFASSGSGTSMGLSVTSQMGVPGGPRQSNEGMESSFTGDRGRLVGVDKFSFLQPVQKDLNRSARDWLKSAGDIADKSLRVTQLQVEQAFPACISRQRVMHRLVFLQSPLEAGIDSVCSWCSVLYRTAVASNGMAILGEQVDHGIGNAAAKVLIDSMTSSRVKELGLVLLKKDAFSAEPNDVGFGMMAAYDRLSEDEVRKLQVKLARAIIVFMEILHVLISYNRDVLLEVMDLRKRSEQMSVNSDFHQRNYSAGRSTSDNTSRRGHARGPSNASHATGFTSIGDRDTTGPHHHIDDTSVSASNYSNAYANERVDKAIPIQSELQRTFINVSKELAPSVVRVLKEETPRWLKDVCRDNYFVAGTYKHAKIRMADEICFYSPEFTSGPSENERDYSNPPIQVMSIDNSSSNRDNNSESPNASQSGRLSRGAGTKHDGRRQAQISGITGNSGSSSILHV